MSVITFSLDTAGGDVLDEVPGVLLVLPRTTGTDALHAVASDCVTACGGASKLKEGKGEKEQ